MRIHIFQHAAFEKPGVVADWAAEQGHTTTYTLLYDKQHEFPAIDDIDALVVMGGPMGAYDDHLHSWLSREKTYITDCIHAGKKVLGICLGAQLVAACLGASVYRAPHKEIGWFAVQPTGDCKSVPWIYEFFAHAPTVFHWHGDTFDIPHRAVHLLHSAATQHQAFLYNDNVLAFQFHAEITPQLLHDMMQHFSESDQPAHFVQSKEEIARGLQHHIEQLGVLMRTILQQFFAGTAHPNSGAANGVGTAEQQTE